MIIKNSFDKKNALSQNNEYQGIGKGVKDINHNVGTNHFIDENLKNETVKEVIRKDHEFDNDDDNGNKWDFFR